MVIMSLVVFGWFTAAIAFNVFIVLKLKPEPLFKAMLIAGSACINTSVAMNYPVYFYFW
jgi:hypothetical protein